MWIGRPVKSVSGDVYYTAFKHGKQTISVSDCVMLLPAQNFSLNHIARIDSMWQSGDVCWAELTWFKDVKFSKL